MSQKTKSENFIFFSILAITVLIPLMFFETTAPMVEVWIVNETFTHGFLILPISLWLLWQKKNEFSGITIIPEPRILVLLLLILVAWFISKVVDVQVVQQLAMVSIIPVLVWLLFGRKLFLTILFPLLYLFFMVPLGQSLIPPLMEFTANFTVFIIKMVGIPVYRDGLHFALPSGNWSVVEECSGVRYLIASVALGTIYAYINYSSTSKRLIFISASIITPLIANGIRASGIVMTGHFSGMKYAVGMDHLLYGWVFFGLVIFIMFYIGSFWWDPITTSRKTTEKLDDTTPFYKIKTFQILTFASLSFLILAKLYTYQVIHDNPDIPDNLSINLPDNFEGWQKSPHYSLDWKPEFTATDASTHSAYRYGNDVVQVDIGYYLYQRQNAEVVSSENRLTNPYSGEWKITYFSDFKDGNFFVRESELRKFDNKILVWQWFKIGDIQTPSPYIAKIFEAYNKIIYGRTDGAYISISTMLSNDKEIARSRLSEFMTTTSIEMNQHLDSLRK